MKKELTPLEVSKQLNDFVLEFVKNSLDRMFIRGSFDTIEAALKRLEVIDKLPKTEFYTTSKIELNNELDKKLKALKIIKEKRVDITTLLDSRNAEEYNRWNHTRSHYIYRPYDITQDEFDLLKEVLY